MTDALTIAFGSRSGSYAALAFFAAVFGLVGGVAAREIRRRGGTRRTVTAVASALTMGPLLLIHLSSTGGFYRADVGRETLALRYLLWPAATAIPLDRLARVETRPSFKGRWRLYIRTTDGTEYESAISARMTVESAVTRLRASTP